MTTGTGIVIGGVWFFAGMVWRSPSITVHGYWLAFLTALGITVFGFCAG